MYHQDEGCANDTCDRRDVTDEMEIEFVVERRVDRLCRTDHEQRVAVSGRAHDRLGADDVVRARSVVDNKLLAEPLRQPLSYQTGRDVGRAGRRDWDDQSRLSRVLFDRRHHAGCRAAPVNAARKIEVSNLTVVSGEVRVGSVATDTAEATRPYTSAGPSWVSARIRG